MFSSSIPAWAALPFSREVMRQRPDAQCLYVADDAGFPYGRLSEPELIARVGTVMARLVADYAPDAVIIACNTASTLVLPHLRAAYPQHSLHRHRAGDKAGGDAIASKLISVLATPGTVARDYTHDLVRTYAAHCDVTLVGSTQACQPRRSLHERRTCLRCRDRR